MTCKLDLSPRDERLRVVIPHGHWKTTTFVSGLRITAPVAPMVIDRPINRLSLQAYVDQVRLPEPHPGDIVITDNLGGHRTPAVVIAIRVAGASLFYLQPDSPDFKPIENAFFKNKAVLRKAASRSIQAPWATIGNLINVFSPAECANFFKNTGYDACCSENALAYTSWPSSGHKGKTGALCVRLCL